MNCKSIIEVLSGYIDKYRCYDYVRGIYSNDRWLDFSSFVRTAEYSAEQMKKAGLEEVEMLPLKADGHTAYGDWVIPRAWDAYKGVLRIVEPSSVENPQLADYNQVPCSLAMYSAPTPEGGVDAEVVVIDNPKTADPNSVRGKIIFTPMEPGNAAGLAIRGGALGVISDFFPLYPGIRDKEDIYDASRWESGFIYPVNDTGLFAFSLSPRNGDRLRGIIAEAEKKGEKVILHAEVEARFYDGVSYTVSGFIPGEDSQGREIMIYGHLSEPGANDNASGCGVVLETATALQKAIKEGILPRPKRGIRFVVGRECSGSMGFCQKHPEIINRTIAGLVTDMVGASSSERSLMNYCHNSISNWSYVDTLLPLIVSEYRKYSGEEFVAEEAGFTVQTDTIIGDPMFGMPTLGMMACPALGYHSSIDNMDCVDPGVLKRNAIIAGTYLYFIASAGRGEARWMMEKVKKHEQEMLEKKADDSLAAQYITAKAFYNAYMSLKTIADGDDIVLINDIYEAANKMAVKALPEKFSINGKIMENSGALIPERKVLGCLTLSQLPKEAVRSSKWRPAWNEKLNIPLYWCDGKRNIWEVAGLSAMELGREDAEEYFYEMLDYFKFLEKHGLMSLK